MLLTGFATTKTITAFVLAVMFFFNAWLLFSGTLKLGESSLKCEDERQTLLSTIRTLQNHMERIDSKKTRGDQTKKVHGDIDILFNSKQVIAWDVKVNKTMTRVLGVQRKTEAFLIVGIPTIQRTRNGRHYLATTLDSLLAQMSDKDRKEVIIVVFAADFDPKQRAAVVRLVQDSYTFHVKSGLIQVIEAPASFYPPLDNLKTNFGDSQDRVKWRAKQCLDYAFLLAYCKGLGRYYLQLEDDVISSRDFLQGIKEFIAMQEKPWITLDFSQLGFIGKLYHDRDVERLAGFLKFFYEEQPVDYLYRYFNAILTQRKSIIRTPSLFQHIGTESTLTGKVQERKDVLFNNTTRKYGNSDNPAAVVSTTLDAFATYVAQLAYSSSPGYFWGRPPIEGDTFTVVFFRPEDIRRVVIETGDDSHPRDRLKQGRLEVSPSIYGQESSRKSDTACNRYKTVKQFVNGRVDAKIDSESLIKCVRIFATGRQDTWLLVKEIAVWT